MQGPFIGDSDLVSRLTNGSDPQLKLLLDEYMSHREEEFQRFAEEQVRIAHAAIHSAHSLGGKPSGTDHYGALDIAYAASAAMDPTAQHGSENTVEYRHAGG